MNIHIAEVQIAVKIFHVRRRVFLMKCRLLVIGITALPDIEPELIQDRHTFLRLPLKCGFVIRFRFLRHLGTCAIKIKPFEKRVIFCRIHAGRNHIYRSACESKASGRSTGHLSKRHVRSIHLILINIPLHVGIAHVPNHHGHLFRTISAVVLVTVYKEIVRQSVILPFQIAHELQSLCTFLAVEGGNPLSVLLLHKFRSVGPCDIREKPASGIIHGRHLKANLSGLFLDPSCQFSQFFPGIWPGNRSVFVQLSRFFENCRICHKAKGIHIFRHKVDLSVHRHHIPHIVLQCVRISVFIHHLSQVSGVARVHDLAYFRRIYVKKIRKLIGRCLGQEGIHTVAPGILLHRNPGIFFLECGLHRFHRLIFLRICVLIRPSAYGNLHRSLILFSRCCRSFGF